MGRNDTEPEPPAAHAVDGARGGLLAEAGLTRYEIRIYLAALGRGACAAKDLARLSGVPRTRVYDVLASLAARGLVEERNGPPRAFVAQSPLPFLECEAQEAADRADSLEKRLEEGFDVPVPARGSAPFRLIEGPVAEGLATAEALAGASASIALDVSAATLAAWLADPEIAPALSRALSLPRVVAVVAGSHVDAGPLAHDPALAGVVAMRSREEAHVERLVVDERVALLRVPRPAGGADLVVVEHEGVALAESIAIAEARRHAIPVTPLATAIQAGARFPIELLAADDAIPRALSRAAASIAWFGPWPGRETEAILAARAAAGVRVRVLGPTQVPLMARVAGIETRVAPAEAPFVVVDGGLVLEPRGPRALGIALASRARLFLGIFEERWARSASPTEDAETEDFGAEDSPTARVRRALERVRPGGAFDLALASDELGALLPLLRRAFDADPSLSGRLLLARASPEPLPPGLDSRVSPHLVASFIVADGGHLIWWVDRLGSAAVACEDRSAVEASRAAFDEAWRRAAPNGRRRP